MDNINPLDMGTYFALKAVASGMEPQNMWAMEHVDDLISQFKFIKGNPKNSIVTLHGWLRIIPPEICDTNSASCRAYGRSETKPLRVCRLA